MALRIGASLRWERERAVTIYGASIRRASGTMTKYQAAWQGIWDSPIWIRVFLGLIAADFVTFFGVLDLPVTVNAVAYLAGAGGHGRFIPTGSRIACGADSGCNTFTDGYLEPGHTPASVLGVVHGSLPARLPIWAWGPDYATPFSRGSAIFWAVIAGGLQLALAGIIAFAAYRGARAWRSARRCRASGGSTSGTA